jgi:hypothetical protein
VKSQNKKATRAGGFFEYKTENPAFAGFSVWLLVQPSLGLSEMFTKLRSVTRLLRESRTVQVVRRETWDQVTVRPIDVGKARR